MKAKFECEVIGFTEAKELLQALIDQGIEQVDLILNYKDTQELIDILYLRSDYTGKPGYIDQYKRPHATKKGSKSIEVQ